MNDPSMWVSQKPCVSSSVSPSSSYPRFSSRSKRQTLDSTDCEKRCVHCDRRVTKLIFTHACTYECALALAMFDRCQYDYVYTMIMSECMNNRDVSSPLPAPPIQVDTITSTEYWKNTINELYAHQPMMQEFLRARLRENNASTPDDVNKRRR